jgi:hypothetical protein
MPLLDEETNAQQPTEISVESSTTETVVNVEGNQRERRPTMRDSVAIGLYDKDKRKSLKRRIDDIRWNGMDYYQAKDCITMWKIYLVINCFLYWFFVFGFAICVCFSIFSNLSKISGSIVLYLVFFFNF